MMYWTNIRTGFHQNLLSQFQRKMYCNPCVTLFRFPQRCYIITRRLEACTCHRFYGFDNLRVIFQNTCRIKYFFPNKDRFNRSQKSKLIAIVYKASCWDCDAFYIGETKRRLLMTERQSTSRLSLKLVTPLLFLIIQLLRVTTSNGTISRA